VEEERRRKGGGRKKKEERRKKKEGEKKKFIKSQLAFFQKKLQKYKNTKNTNKKQNI